MQFCRLVRTATIPEQGTFGALSINGSPFCVTLEPYHQKIIPAWQYVGDPFKSPSNGNVYLLRSVTDKTMIELHPGNLVKHTKGCIILAQYYGKLQGDLAILNSGATFKEFLRLMNNDTLHLTIMEAF